MTALWKMYGDWDTHEPIVIVDGGVPVLQPSAATAGESSTSLKIPGVQRGNSCGGAKVDGNGGNLHREGADDGDDRTKQPHGVG